MSWGKVMTTDNRREVKEKRLTQQCANGRTWTRRCTWLESNDSDHVKLKFEWDDQYREVLVPPGFIELVWDRWKAGGSVDDCLSIFAKPVPRDMQSRRRVER